MRLLWSLSIIEALKWFLDLWKQDCSPLGYLETVLNAGPWPRCLHQVPSNKAFHHMSQEGVCGGPDPQAIT